MLLSNTATIVAMCVESVDDKGDHHGYHYVPVHADDLDCKDHGRADDFDCQDRCRTDHTVNCSCR